MMVVVEEAGEEEEEEDKRRLCGCEGCLQLRKNYTIMFIL